MRDRFKQRILCVIVAALGSDILLWLEGNSLIAIAISFIITFGVMLVLLTLIEIVFNSQEDSNRGPD